MLTYHTRIFIKKKTRHTVRGGEREREREREREQERVRVRERVRERDRETSCCHVITNKTRDTVGGGE